MSCAFRLSARQSVALLWPLLLMLSPQASGAEDLDYSYVEVGYAVDSTAEAYGQTYDSDSSFRVQASYLLNSHLLFSAQMYTGGYDIAVHEEYHLTGYSLGVGYRGRISDKKAMPVDWFVSLSYEHNITQSQVGKVNSRTGRNGGGLRVGIRAAVTDNFEVGFEAYERAFGTDFLRRNGDLDALSFELGAALELNDHISLTAAYRTGELDYKFLDNFPKKYEIELDQDEVIVGVRVSY
jgi:Outer membrane protein beta-barrel domain